MKKVVIDDYWYLINEIPCEQKINNFYIQPQYDKYGKIEKYIIRKIISNYSFDILFSFKKEGYYPIDKDFIPNLYEIENTNNKFFKKYLRKKKIKRLLKKL